jgi:putative DNA primase/helicase
LETLAPGDLPNICRPFLENITVRLQCPLEYAAAPFIVGFSALVGRRVALRLHEHDDWLIVPNLWGAVIGPPGAMKRAAFSRALAPLAELQNETLANYRRARHEYLKKCRRTNADRRVRKPLCRRFLVKGASPEKLCHLLRQNPTGLLVLQDDLAVCLRGMNRLTDDLARALYRAAAVGEPTFTYSRASRAETEIPSLCLSLFGGIRPQVLQSLLETSRRARLETEAALNGFSLLFWPDLAPSWKFCDPPPTDEPAYSVLSLFRRIAAGDAVPANLLRDHDSKVPFVQLTPAARELYVDWRTDFENSLRRGGTSQLLASHRARYRSVVPALALLFRILDRGVGDVDEADFALAQRWQRILESHAQRVYATVAEDAAPQSLLKHLLAHRQHWTSFGWYDLRRCQWAALHTPAALSYALMTLSETGHIRPCRRTRDGHTIRYELNPFAR